MPWEKNKIFMTGKKSITYKFYKAPRYAGAWKLPNARDFWSRFREISLAKVAANSAGRSDTLNVSCILEFLCRSNVIYIQYSFHCI